MIKDSGESRVTAAVGGRRLTLDPIRVLPVQLEVREVENTIPCGFQSEWATADVEGSEMMVTVGAGFGSRWGTIRYAGKSYAFEVGQLAEAFMAALAKAPA
jgi:hypothetical protein